MDLVTDLKNFKGNDFRVYDILLYKVSKIEQKK